MKTGRTLLAVLLVGALAVLLFLGARQGWLTLPASPAAPAASENGSGAEAPSGTPPQLASADPAVPADAGEAWVE